MAIFPQSFPHSHSHREYLANTSTYCLVRPKFYLYLSLSASCSWCTSVAYISLSVWSIQSGHTRALQIFHLEPVNSSFTSPWECHVEERGPAASPPSDTSPFSLKHNVQKLYIYRETTTYEHKGVHLWVPNWYCNNYEECKHNLLRRISNMESTQRNKWHHEKKREKRKKPVHDVDADLATVPVQASSL